MVSEQLREILGVSVGDGPLVVGGVVFSFLSFSLGFSRCCFSGFFLALTSYFHFLFFDYWLFKLLPLLVFKFGRLNDVLETEHGCDLTDVLLNGENLVHVPEGKSVDFFLHLCVVAKSFQQYDALVGTSLSNSVLDKFHHNVLIIVDWIVSGFTSFIF